jgi:YD repeat-containing protein
MTRKRPMTGLILLFILGFASPLWAQSTSPVQYVYDALGRLTTVVDPSGNVANYNYDAVGNLLSITRSTSSPSALAIRSFAPTQGSVGQTVTIQGQNFSTTASSNTVQFNGTTATVTAATANSLTVTVPSGATTGPIAVTVSGATATSSTNFTLISPALITIAVNPTSPIIGRGATQRFSATGTYLNGTTQDITATVTWSSSNSGVASISNTTGSQGQSTSIANGLSQITAQSGTIVGSAALTVKSLVAMTVSPGNRSILQGATQQFVAQASFDDGTTSNVTQNATWSTSNPAVATISNAPGSQGLATALGTGSTTITGNFQGHATSVSLNVISLASISVTPASPSVAKGGTKQFTATATYSDGSSNDLTSGVTWSSSNISVALISNTVGSVGLARTPGAGTTTITATSGSISGSTTLTVTAPTPVSLALTPGNLFIPVNSTRQFRAIVSFTDGSTQDVTSTATWSSSAPTIATISSQGLASALAIGSTTVTATSNGFTNSVTLGVANSVATGTITFADGSPVQYPDVFITQTDSQGNLLTFFTSATDQNGNYWVANIGLGAFNVVAQDSQSGLNASAAGSLTATSTPATVNIQLPAGGTVSGTFRLPTGGPIPNAGVKLFPAGAVLSANFGAPYGIFVGNRGVTSDAQGSYTFNRVAAGEVVVVASQPAAVGSLGLDINRSGPYIGASVGNLSNGQSLALDVTLPATSTVTGTVFATDGVTPVPNATVFGIQNTSISGGLAEFFADGIYGNSPFFQTDASGNFRFDVVPVGPVTVVAGPLATANSPKNILSGATTGTLTGASPLALSPVIGNAYNFGNDGPYYLTDPNSFVYDIDFDGEVDRGGQNNGFQPFRGAAQLYVNENFPDNFFCGGCYATLDQGGKQLTIGPHPSGPSFLMLQVQRKVFMPTSGGYIRYVDSFTNPLDVPISTNIVITSGFSAAPNTVLADPQTNGNTFAVFQNSAQALSPIIGFVFAGKSGKASANAFNYLSNYTPAFDYQWNEIQGPAPAEFDGAVTIGPHQTVSFMHFVIQWNNQDAAGAIAQAQALVNMTDPNEFVGLSTQERSQVVNFNVP